MEHRKRIFALVGIPDQPPKKKTDSSRTVSALDLAIADAERKLEMKLTRRDPYDHKFIVARFDNGKSKKECRPFFLSAGGWAMKDPPGKLPLFNLTQLRERPQEEVVLVEGEKCACELRERGRGRNDVVRHGQRIGAPRRAQPAAAVHGVHEHEWFAG